MSDPYAALQTISMAIAPPKKGSLGWGSPALDTAQGPRLSDHFLKQLKFCGIGGSRKEVFKSPQEIRQDWPEDRPTA